jgi:hypothetical protein
MCEPTPTWRCVFLLAALLATGGCLDHELAPGSEEEGGGHSAGDGPAGGSTFLAQQRDFGDYEDWMPFDTELSDEHGGVVGTVTEYLNRMPEPGADSFPIGTMIVKTVEPTDGEPPAIHAMAKRGGAFNKQGALGWEYFELRKSDQGTPIIIWRGPRPPSGEQYRSLLRMNDLDDSRVEVDCNSCHVVSQNDAVLSEALDLKSFQ